MLANAARFRNRRETDATKLSNSTSTGIRPPAARGTSLADVSVALSRGSPYPNPQLASSQTSIASTTSTRGNPPLLRKAIQKVMKAPDAAPSQETLVPREESPEPQVKTRSSWTRAITPRSSSASLRSGKANVPSPRGSIDEENGKRTTSPLNGTSSIAEEKTRRLEQELTDTNTKLAEVAEERSTLQNRLSTLEEEGKKQELEWRLKGEAVDGEKAYLIQAHATEVEAMKQEVQELRQTLDHLNRNLEETVRVKGTLAQEVSELKNRRQEDGVTIEAIRAEAEVLRDSEERCNVLLGEFREEKEALDDKLRILVQRLEDAESRLTGSEEQIQDLRATEGSMKEALHQAETEAGRKDQTVRDLRHRNESLTGDIDAFKRRVVQIEEEAIGAKNAAQALLARTNDDFQRAMTDMEAKTKALQDQVSSYPAIVKGLRSSCDTARADADKSRKLAEDRAIENRVLQQRLSALEESLSAKDKELAGSTASHAARESLLDNNISVFRERIASLEDRYSQAVSAVDAAKIQRVQVETKLNAAYGKLRELQLKYEMSEKRCRELEGLGQGSPGIFSWLSKWYYGH